MIYNKGITDKGKYQPYIDGKKSKVYGVWQGMLQRCYDVKLHKRYPTYIGCSVCEEWLYFQNFAEWFEENYKEGLQLDKDLRVRGNKIYSPETCCFVTNKVNNLFHINKTKNKRGLLTGVTIQDGRYRAQCNTGSGSRHIGYFDTEKEARDAYLKVKTKHVESVIKTGWNCNDYKPLIR